MHEKTLFIIGIFICLLFAVPMVSAADLNLMDDSIGSDINSQAIAAADANSDNDIANVYSNVNAENDDGMGSINDNPSEIANVDSDNDNSNDRNGLGSDILGAGGAGNSFTDLQYLIDNAIANGENLTLDRNFVFTPGEDDGLVDGIVISSPITITGDSHYIDADNMARIFVITSNNVFLDGITFKNGETKSTSDHDANGGAIYVIGDNVTIDHCTFINNTAYEDAGAIFIEGDDCTLNNTVFLDNVAHNDGGAIEWRGHNGRIYNLTASGNYADSGTGSSKGGTILSDSNNMVMDKLNISNSHVSGEHYTGDKAIQGGAIAISGNYTNLTNSVFTNCSVDYYKKDSNASGGALYIYAHDVNLVNCNFTNNSAGEDGGAIFIDGDNCTLNHTVFTDNFAHNDGGAFEWHGDNGKVYDLTASGNYADSLQGYLYGDSTEGSSKGGTITVTGNYLTLDKLNISNTNVSGEHYNGTNPPQGGAIFLTGNYTNLTNSVFTNCSVVWNGDDASGGALYINGHDVNVVNCNFTDNSASEDGGAIYIKGDNCTLNHTVFTDNVAHNDGGAIEWQGSNGRIYDLNASGNYGDSGTGSSKGGTLLINGHNLIMDQAHIYNSSVSGANYAGNNTIQGGAIYLTGNNVTITNSVFDNCSAKHSNSDTSGGAIYIVGNNATMDNCSFTNNYASSNGGAILIAGDDNLITNSNISDNYAKGDGGGVYYKGNRNTVSYCNIDHNDGNNGANVYMAANGKNCQLIGSNITNAKARNFGGGVEWLQGSVNCTIKDCYFYNLSAKNHGGGIHWYPGTNGTVDNCTFIDCKVDGTKNGGAIYAGANTGGTSKGTVLSNSTFINCTSGTRGAVNWNAQNGLIYNNTFINCGGDWNATLDWGGRQALQIEKGHNTQIIECKFYNCTGIGGGGALRVQDQGENITIANCTFDNCTNRDDAGAVYINKGKNLVIENNTFTNNYADSIGAMYIDSEANIKSFVNNTFINNTAKNGNAGAALLSGNAFIENSTFINNNCTGSGGALYVNGDLKISGSTFENNSAGADGGAISATEGANLIVDDSTFKYNKADYGSAIKTSTIDMSDSLLLENQASFDRWDNTNHEITDDHVSINGTFVGKDNLVNAIYADSGTFDNVTYCGKSGESSNTDTDEPSNSFNEVYQIVVLEIYDGDTLIDSKINYTDENGNYNFEVDLPSLGNYIFKVIHPEDNYYTESEYTIERTEPQINISCEDIDYGQDENISIKVTGDGETPTGNITVIINDTNGNEVYNGVLPLNESGGANLTLSGLIPGEYNINVLYHGDSNYFQETAIANFTVGKAVPTVNVNTSDITYGETETISGNVTGVENGVVPTGTVNVTVSDEDGNNITFNDCPIDDSGKVKVPVSGLRAGKYTVTVEYSGDEKYTSTTGVANFTVNKIPPTVDVDTVDIDYHEDETIEVTVPEDATGNVTITVNGKKYTTPVKDGKAVFNVPGLKAGKYTVQAFYSGDNNYLPMNATAEFTVSKIKPDISTFAPTIVEGNDGKITVKVPKDATGKITIEIEGKNYTANIKDGEAVFIIPGLKAGKHDFKVYYSGDDNYLSATVDGEFIKVLPNKNNGHKDKVHHNGIDLASKPTGNPIFALVLVFALLGFMPLRRKKDEDDDENP